MTNVEIRYIETQLERACPLPADHEAIGQISIQIHTQMGKTNFLNITPRQLGLIEEILLGVTK